MRDTLPPLTLVWVPSILHLASPFSVVALWRLLCKLWSSLSNWGSKRLSLSNSSQLYRSNTTLIFSSLLCKRCFLLDAGNFAAAEWPCWGIFPFLSLSLHWTSGNHYSKLGDCMCAYTYWTHHPIACSNAQGKLKYLPHSIWLLKLRSKLAITRVMI